MTDKETSDFVDKLEKGFIGVPIHEGAFILLEVLARILSALGPDQAAVYWKTFKDRFPLSLQFYLTGETKIVRH